MSNLTLSTSTDENIEKEIDNDFDNIKVSVKTFVIMTNLTLDINELFNFLPITEYILIPIKRGRKKKKEIINPNKNIQTGSIITLEYQNNIRGVDLKTKAKKKKKEIKKGNYFRNSLTIIMMIDNKKINYKVSRNGKFQITGCKKDEHSEDCLKWLWTYIKDSKNIYKFNKQYEDLNKKEIVDGVDGIDGVDGVDGVGELKAMIIPAMRNIDFSLNFYVDREKLDEYFNTCTNYHSLLETSFGYTGVNIKIPIKKSIKELMLKEITCINDVWNENKYIPYTKYLYMLPEKERMKKLKKRYNTFLVFHSGKIIMSGLEYSFMKDIYYEFLNIIKDCRHLIEEKLDIE